MTTPVLFQLQFLGNSLESQSRINSRIESLLCPRTTGHDWLLERVNTKRQVTPNLNMPKSSKYIAEVLFKPIEEYIIFLKFHTMFSLSALSRGQHFPLYYGFLCITSHTRKTTFCSPPNHFFSV